MRTDASDVGIGAILLQKRGEGWKPVSYASRQLLERETKYIISEKECLAVIFGIKKFRPYLEGQHFKIVTDHCSLCFLKNKTSISPRLTRWALELQEFDYELEYKSGNYHKDADCLSRYPIEKTEIEQDEDRALIMAMTTLDNTVIQKEQQNDKFCSKILSIFKTYKILMRGEGNN